MTNQLNERIKYLGLSEMHARYGNSDTAAKMRFWRIRNRKVHPFPPPDLWLGERTPMWKMETVEKWEAEEQVRPTPKAEVTAP